MSEHKTTLLDVYEAAGGKVNEDRTSVTMDGSYKPFKIELLVAPIGVEMDGMGVETVKFSVLLDREHLLLPGPIGTRVEVREHYAEVALPVDQVKIIKEDRCSSSS